MGIPWRVAFALQDDGWIRRQDIIWNKPNCQPESVKDRCTKAHEYIFLLTKSEHYHYDWLSIREEAKWERWGDQTVVKGSQGSVQWMTGKTKEELQDREMLKNRRSVWNIPTKPLKEAHFAAYPMELVEICLKAGCPENGTVFDPFGGSGTTALVALMNDRKAILCELNPEYCKIAESRINKYLDSPENLQLDFNL